MAVNFYFLLLLSGLKGVFSVTTIKKVSVKAGDSIHIPCLYESKYRSSPKYVCKGDSFISCTVQTERRISISDDKQQTILNVTINDLSDRDNAWWWCAVELSGLDAKDYFFVEVTTDIPNLYVDHQLIKGNEGGKITLRCTSHKKGKMEWCRLGGNCVSSSSGSIDGTAVTIDSNFTVTMSGLKTESSGWYWCDNGHSQMPVYVNVSAQTTTFPPSKAPSLSLGPDPPTSQGEQNRGLGDLTILLISLGLLILIVIITTVIWFQLKRKRQTRVELSATTGQAEDEVTYSNVTCKRNVSGEMLNDGDPIYSSVITMELQNVPMVQQSEGVIYSTLAPMQ